jgi:5-methylcytosine-specific restriction endonuclease McrA
MFVKPDFRRRWLQYGENRVKAYEDALSTISRHGSKFYECQNKSCDEVMKKEHCEVDHIRPVGKRPYTPEEMVGCWKRMFLNKCQVLCSPCHNKKKEKERKRRQAK